MDERWTDVLAARIANLPGVAPFRNHAMTAVVAPPSLHRARLADLGSGFFSIEGLCGGGKKSQSRAVPSLLLVKMVRPSGAIATLWTFPPCLSGAESIAPVLVSHTLAVLSSLQLAMRTPSG